MLRASRLRGQQATKKKRKEKMKEESLKKKTLMNLKCKGITRVTGAPGLKYVGAPYHSMLISTL